MSMTANQPPVSSLRSYPDHLVPGHVSDFYGSRIYLLLAVVSLSSLGTFLSFGVNGMTWVLCAGAAFLVFGGLAGGGNPWPRDEIAVLFEKALRERLLASPDPVRRRLGLALWDGPLSTVAGWSSQGFAANRALLDWAGGSENGSERGEWLARHAASELNPRSCLPPPNLSALVHEAYARAGRPLKMCGATRRIYRLCAAYEILRDAGECPPHDLIAFGLALRSTGELARKVGLGDAEVIAGLDATQGALRVLCPATFEKVGLSEGESPPAVLGGSDEPAERERIRLRQALADG